MLTSLDRDTCYLPATAGAATEAYGPAVAIVAAAERAVQQLPDTAVEPSWLAQALPSR